jgi:hypothetical protein
MLPESGAFAGCSSMVPDLFVPESVATFDIGNEQGNHPG